MRKQILTLLCVVMAASVVGCSRDNSPSVQRVPPPAPGQDTPRREYEPNKPMPGEVAPERR